LIKELFILVNIFETIDIEINLNDIKFSEYFNPIFIDENLSKKEFGKTQNVIMLNKDFFYAKKEKEFLNNFKWAKVLLVSDKYLDKNNENEYEETIKYLSSIDNIVKYLKSNSFNFIIYYGDNRKKLENIINSKPIENTLF
jgi:vacuolar-type H+-ATPase subunit I/STV1